MKAIILAGGKAERMDGYPKPLTFVNGYTIIELEIEWLFKAGFSTNDILIACGNRSQIYDYARRFVPKNNIYFDGEKQLGDAGAIKKGMEIAGKNHSYLVLNGDLVILFEPKRFIKFYKELSSKYIGVVVAKQMNSQYGVFEKSNGKQTINSFNEKPEIGLGSCGIYFFRGSINKLLPSYGSLAKSIISKHFSKLYLYEIDKNDWIAIETQKDITYANNYLKKRGL